MWVGFLGMVPPRDVSSWSCQLYLSRRMEVSLGDSCGCVTTALGFFPQEVSIGGYHTLSGVDAEKLIGRDYTGGRQRVHDRGRWAQLKVVAFSVGNMILVVRRGMHTNAGELLKLNTSQKIVTQGWFIRNLAKQT